jgi:hypothetical protein
MRFPTGSTDCTQIVPENRLAEPTSAVPAALSKSQCKPTTASTLTKYVSAPSAAACLYLCLQCGFIASAPEPLAFTSLLPFFVPQSSSAPCYCKRPFAVKPYQGAGGPSSSSSQAEAITNAGVAKSLAEAMSQAFGGECLSMAELTS